MFFRAKKLDLYPIWAVVNSFVFPFSNNSYIDYALEKLKSNSSSSAKESSKTGGSNHIAAQTFTFRELAAATKNFRPECLLGEGGFGRVYKGRLESTSQVSHTHTYI